MKDEIIKVSDDIKNLSYQNALINQTRKSYITKENFIEIISKLDFDRIQSASIYFITSYEYIPENKDKDKDRREYVRTFGYELNIS